ncbi:MAG: hemerythrin domain-containing protein [Terracidiphilus sp.]
MAVQIGKKPDAGFDDPIGMLKDCHRRIENFLRVLCIVAERAGGRALTPEEGEAVAGALRYFQDGGARHNADEEESLFPRMRGAAALDSELHELAGLEGEHREAGELHAKVERLYRRWLDQHVLGADDAGLLLEATRRLETLYARHIEAEETVVFPRAASCLAPATLAAIGAEFKARRR